MYFEIYSLTRDDFGQTRYEVAFEVRARGKKERASLLTGVKKRTGETVSVRYEQVGRELTQKDYVELDLGKAKPGWYTVQMAVTDVNSGVETTRSGDFRVMKR